MKILDGDQGRRFCPIDSTQPGCTRASEQSHVKGAGVVEGQGQSNFEWAEGNPFGHLFRYLGLERNDTAPVVREILRTVEPDPVRRPSVHVGG